MDSFTLAGYQILEKIGEGGTATVWKARHLSLDRIVAIKILAKGYLADQDALNRFRSEAQAAAKLNHPGIVHVYDAGEQNGQAYYVMEFVDGSSVGDLLLREGKIKEGDALIIAESVALALDYAWQKAQIIHCDIKPDNIMIDRDGSIKVADLGLARVFDRRYTGSRQEIIWGTPNYVSPEQASGKVDLDCRSDIYSLGAMLFHLVTGVLPFKGSPGSTAMDKHITDYLDDPRTLNPEVSDGVAWLIEKLMVKDREARPASWGLVLADVQEVRNGGFPCSPLPAEGLSTVRRSEKRGQPALATGAKRKIFIPKKETEEPTAPKLHVVHDAGKAMRIFILLLCAVIACYGILFFMANKKTEPVEKPETLLQNIPQTGSEAAAPPKPEEPPNDLYGGTRAPASVESLVDQQPVVAGSPPLTQPSSASTSASSWNNPNFIKAADLYNAALRTYKQFLQDRQNRENLPNVEQQVHQAVTLFEICRDSAPPEVNIDYYVTECNRLMFDIHQSIHINTEQGQRRPLHVRPWARKTE